MRCYYSGRYSTDSDISVFCGSFRFWRTNWFSFVNRLVAVCSYIPSRSCKGASSLAIALNSLELILPSSTGFVALTGSCQDKYVAFAYNYMLFHENYFPKNLCNGGLPWLTYVSDSTLNVSARAIKFYFLKAWAVRCFFLLLFLSVWAPVYKLGSATRQKRSFSRALLTVEKQLLPFATWRKDTNIKSNDEHNLCHCA